MASEAAQRVEAVPIEFKVELPLPSLENFRKRGMGATEQQRRAAARKYNRILKAKDEIGWRCREAATPGQIKRLFGERLAVKIMLYDQKIDADNVKLVVDALKGVVYPDDKKKFVRRVCTEHGEDGTYSKPTVIVRVSLYDA